MEEEGVGGGGGRGGVGTALAAGDDREVVKSTDSLLTLL